MAEEGYLVSQKLLKELRKVIRYELSRAKGRPMASQGTEPNGKKLLFVKLKADLNYNSYANADIYNPPTSTTDGGPGAASENTIKTVKVYAAAMVPSGSKIASGTYLWVTNTRGRWELVQASTCPV